MTIEYADQITIDTRPTAHGWRASTTIGRISFSVDRCTETEARARLVEIFAFDRHLARAWRTRNANADA